MIPKLQFGRTGHLSTRVIFGAVAVGQSTQDEADRTLDLLLRYDINHIDTAASYGHSELARRPVDEAVSEPVLPGHQDR